MSKRLGTSTIAALAVLAVGAITATVAVDYARESDHEHENFYSIGRSVNEFLTNYCAASASVVADSDHAALEAHYSHDFLARGRGQVVWADLSPLSPGSTITRAEMTKLGTSDVYRADALQEALNYFGGFASVEKSSCKIGLIESVDEPDIQLTVHLLFNWTGASGAKGQDRFEHRWTLRDESPSEATRQWKIVSDEAISGERSSAHEAAFDEPDLSALGIDYTHSRDPNLSEANELAFGVMQHGPGGVSTVDYDGDRRVDLFFPDGVHSRLYRNERTDVDGRPQFVDVTETAGLGTIGGAMAGIFADVDNDGDKDLFVTRYAESNKFFENDGNGRFTDRSVEMGLAEALPSVSAVFFDYDNDGFLDLYLALYGDAFHEIPRLPFFARNGEENRLYRNVAGDGPTRRFEIVPDAAGANDSGWSLAVAAADYDRNGYPDLLVANDFGRKNLYRNNGDGTFTEVSKDAGTLDFGAGMGVAFADFDDDGNLDFYTANIQSNQRWYGEESTILYYIRKVFRTKWALVDGLEYWELYSLLEDGWRELGKTTGEGNSLFRNRADGTFEELKDSGTNRAGWAWGVAFFDPDNDSDLDIYALNGWISARPNTDL